MAEEQEKKVRTSEDGQAAPVSPSHVLCCLSTTRKEAVDESAADAFLRLGLVQAAAELFRATQ